MDNQIFRKKSLDKISSPDDLNNYLRVTTPSVWLGLMAIILLLTGILIWSGVDTLETKTEALVEVNNGEAIVTVTGSKAEEVKEGMVVRVDKKETILDDVSIDEYGRAIGSAILNIDDGKYKAEVVIESVKPISFLFK